MFENIALDWDKTSVSPHLTTIDTILRCFEYKILNTVSFLIKKIYTFGITNTALCSFCNNLEETPMHIFFHWIHVKCIWERLGTKFQNDFILQSLTLQTAILGLYNEANDNDNFLNHILLIFKYYIYISREKSNIKYRYFNSQLNKSKKKEKQIGIVTINKSKAYKKSGALRITLYQ